LYASKVDGNLGLIVVYVDNLIIPSSNKDDLNEIMLISKKFYVVDGGDLKHFLGMEIEREGEIGHTQYVEALLNDYGMQNCCSMHTYRFITVPIYIYS